MSHVALGALATSVLLFMAPAAYADPPAEAHEKAEGHAEAAHAAEGHAAEGHAEGEQGEHGESHHRFMFGVNGQALGAFADGAKEGKFGAGAFFEVVAVPSWLEIELAAHYLRTTSGINEVPIDLMLKKPFHPTTWFNPYVGIGGTVVPAFGGGESAVAGGLAVGVGSYFWLNHHVGLSLEINYNLLGGKEGIVNEVGGTSGLVFGF